MDDLVLEQESAIKHLLMNANGDVCLQEVKLTIEQYEMLIQSMVSRSRDVPPLTMRSQRQSRPVLVIALCSYKHCNVC